MGIKISDLPSGSAEQTAFAPVTNAAGTETSKVTLMGIASLATKQTVGLANVDNTSDANKPISSAVQAALDLKASSTHNHDASAINSGTLNSARLPASVVRTGSVTPGAIQVEIVRCLPNPSPEQPGDFALWEGYNGVDATSAIYADGSASFVSINLNGTNLQYALDGKQPVTTVAELAYASSVATNASAGDIFDITLTGNVTLENPTNPVNGKTIRWRITQDATGNRAVTLGSKFAIPSSATSPLPFSTAANKMDILAATYHAGRDRWDVVAFVPGY